MLTDEEHIAETRSCLQTVQYLTGLRRHLQASEILWSAVKHAVSAIAILNGQEYGKYQHKRAVVTDLASTRGDDQLKESLRVAMQIHADADKGFLDMRELLSKQRETWDFVATLLNIATELNTTPRQTK